MRNWGHKLAGSNCSLLIDFYVSIIEYDDKSSLTTLNCWTVVNPLAEVIPVFFQPVAEVSALWC